MPLVPAAAVVVDNADPAPFSAAAFSGADAAAKVQPVEPLGALSGISFGGGLLLWPLLLAINLVALGALARMAVRRRLATQGD